MNFYPETEGVNYHVVVLREDQLDLIAERVKKELKGGCSLDTIQVAVGEEVSEDKVSNVVRVDGIKEQPLYVHDCNLDIYLGRFKDRSFKNQERTYDLWYADHTHSLGLEGWTPKATIIARWGNAGPDYISGIEFAYSNRAILEGTMRAVYYGLLKREV